CRAVAFLQRDDHAVRPEFLPQTFACRVALVSRPEWDLPGTKAPQMVALATRTNPPTQASASATWHVEVLREADQAHEHRAAWDDLAAHALERNPFYESW